MYRASLRRLSADRLLGNHDQRPSLPIAGFRCTPVEPEKAAGASEVFGCKDISEIQVIARVRILVDPDKKCSLDQCSAPSLIP